MSAREQGHIKHDWHRRMADWFVMGNIFGGSTSSLNASSSSMVGLDKPLTRVIGAEELRQHAATATHMWMAVHGVVYDVTRFADFHPGGRRYVEEWAGMDATDIFDHHHAHVEVKEAIGATAVGTYDPSHVSSASSGLTSNAANSAVSAPTISQEDRDAFAAAYQSLAEQNDGTVTVRCLLEFVRNMEGGDHISDKSERKVWEGIAKMRGIAVVEMDRRDGGSNNVVSVDEFIATVNCL